ncbi:F0F1 ATP synthase subunit B [Sediminimonas sp.]|uniref:F0F1 ATP synthase subunit B n=1 Tax=Sediminimonas sp. TaxID=2823379 RepID=UPI0025EC4E39|nr:F0F1 ATP synthase subunit B [Sediminimonas sp.]
MRNTAILSAAGVAAATPALAASGPFFSLGNTDFIVLLGFLLFVGVLIYFKVPGLLMGMLDKRAAGIRSELDEARALREEAQALLASYERQQKEAQAQADRIVAQAKDEANASAEQAKQDIKRSVERRKQAAEEQLASAEAKAIRQVRDQAIAVAIEAARDVVAKKMTAAQGNALIDDAIEEVDKKLH